jgi:5-formyltetrahydrofolate cyclo-ligase
MDSSLEQSKAKLRKELRAAIAVLSQADRESASARAVALLSRQPAWNQAGSVLFYAPIKEELDVWPLLKAALEAGKVTTLPRFDVETYCYKAHQIKDLRRDLELGRYGIREPRMCCNPVPLNRLDFVLVPGVGFDLHGRRIGRGKGYYDQMLTAVRGKTCGVAFDQQIVREIPVGPHDSDVNCILTPTRWIEL